MNLKLRLLSIFTGSLAVAILPFPTPAFAQKSDKDIDRVASGVTVQIFGQNPGSGVIIAKKGKTYYVLTASHVVKTSDEYDIITPDRKQHRLNYNTVRKVKGVDLAVIEFDSNESYQVAQIGNSKLLGRLSKIYISGFPQPIEKSPTDKTNYSLRVVDGKISGLEAKPDEGYELAYSNITATGVSGGPILDDEAMLVGIHGRAEGTRTISSTGNTSNSKTGINFGIPLQTFLDLAPRSGINLNLQIRKPAYGTVPQVPKPVIEPPRIPQYPSPDPSPDPDPGVCISDCSTNLPGPPPEGVEPDDGITYIEIGAQPGDARTYLGRGNVRYTQGDFGGAVEDFTEAINLQPDFPEAYFNRGNAHRMMESNDSAYADYFKAIELSQDSAFIEMATQEMLEVTPDTSEP